MIKVTNIRYGGPYQTYSDLSIPLKDPTTGYQIIW